MDLLLTARTPKQLSEKLRALDLHSAANVIDPEKRAIELYSLVCLLQSLHWSEAQFPLRVFKRERPDFVLVCNDNRIGLEHTEAIGEHAAKVRHQRLQQADPGQVLSTPLLLLDTPRGSTVATEDQFEGVSAEQYWANSIGYLIQRKCLNAQKDGYQRYEQNQLMVHDSLPISPLHYSRAIALLRQRLGEQVWQTFERLYILDQHLILELSEFTQLSHRVLR